MDHETNFQLAMFNVKNTIAVPSTQRENPSLWSGSFLLSSMWEDRRTLAAQRPRADWTTCRRDIRADPYQAQRHDDSPCTWHLV